MRTNAQDAVAVGSEAPDLDVEPPGRRARRFVAGLPRGAAVLPRRVWFWPSLVMAAIGFWRIGRPQLWQDELVTVTVAGRSLRQITALLGEVDAVHGAYYYLMHVSVAVFGDSPAALRAPSALAMAGAAGVTALIGQRLFGGFAGLLGGLVFTVAPITSRFAQEARSYAFVVLFAALSTLLLLRALDRPTWRRFAGYALCVTALAAFNPVSMSLVVAHAVALLVRRDWRVQLRHAGAVLAGLVLALPAVVLGLRQVSRQVSWVEADAPWVTWPKVYASAAVAWTVTGLALAAWAHPKRPAVVMATVFAVLPLVVVGLASLASIEYWFSKYLMFVVPMWAVAAGAGLAAVRSRVVSTTVLVLLAVLSLPGQVDLRRDLAHSWWTYPAPRSPATPPTDYRGAADLIAAGYHAGDGIVYYRHDYWWFMLEVGVGYYLPRDVRPRDVFAGRSAADGNGFVAADCAEPARCIGAEPRLWVVVPWWHDNPQEAFTPPEQAVLRQYSTVLVRHPSGMTIALLQRPS